MFQLQKGQVRDEFDRREKNKEIEFLYMAYGVCDKCTSSANFKHFVGKTEKMYSILKNDAFITVETKMGSSWFLVHCHYSSVLSSLMGIYFCNVRRSSPKWSHLILYTVVIALH